MNQPRHPSSLKSLILWFFLTFAAASIGALGSTDAPNFYTKLNLPSWAPRPAIFGPVWTVLYILIAVAAWIAWRNRTIGQSLFPFTLFIIQLALNALWSWLFFHFKSGGMAFGEILILILTVIATSWLFSKYSKLAGALMVPYILWIAFASYLNYTVWQLNPQVLG